VTIAELESALAVARIRITQLESENQELRQKMLELERELAGHASKRVFPAWIPIYWQPVYIDPGTTT